MSEQPIFSEASDKQEMAQEGISAALAAQSGVLAATGTVTQVVPLPDPPVGDGPLPEDPPDPLPPVGDGPLPVGAPDPLGDGPDGVGSDPTG